MNTNTRTLFVIAAMMVFVISCQKQTPPPPQPTPLKFTPSFKEWVLQWEVGNMGSASAYFICDRNSPSIGVHSTNPKILIVEPIRFSQFDFRVMGVGEAYLVVVDSTTWGRDSLSVAVY